MKALNWSNATSELIFDNTAFYGCGPMDSLNGKLIFSAGQGMATVPSLLNVYDYAAGKIVFSNTLVLEQQTIRASSISNCAYYAAAGGMWALNLQTYQAQQVWPSNGPFYLTHGPQGKMVILLNGVLQVLAIQADGSLSLTASVPTALSPDYWDIGLTLSNDGNYVASASGYDNNLLQVLDLTTGATTNFSIAESPSGIYSPLVTNQVSPTNVCVVFGGGYASGDVWIVNLDLSDGSYTILATLTGMISYVYSVAVTLDNRYLLAAGFSTVQLYDLRTLQPVWTIPNGAMLGVVTNASINDQMNYITCAFSAGGRAAISGFAFSDDPQFALPTQNQLRQILQAAPTHIVLQVQPQFVNLPAAGSAPTEITSGTSPGVSKSSTGTDLSERKILSGLGNVFSFSRTKFNNISASWMSFLVDDTNLRSIIIPGTHDSGAIDITFSVVSPGSSQRWLISEQLNNGIRFLDLRVGFSSEKELWIFHSGALCFQTLASAFKEMYAFLAANPSETVIVSLKGEVSGEDVTASVQSYIAANKSMWLSNPTQNVTIGQARGKAIAMDRAGLGSIALPFPSGSQLQDAWDESDTDKKTELVEKFLNESSTLCASQFGANFLTSQFIGLGIGYIASKVNHNIANFLYNHRKNRYAGIMPMDFPTDELIFAMIMHAIGRK